MTATTTFLVLLGIAAAIGVAIYTYRALEPTGRGRGVLIALRAAALALIVLLLADPHFSKGRPASRNGETRVVLDASLSMMLRGARGTAWSDGVAEAQRAAHGQPVLLAGSDLKSANGDSLARVAPYAGESRILPALQSAAEAGAQRVVLITDGSIDDAQDAARWLPSLGIKLDVKNVGGAIPNNRAISDVAAPAWAENGKPFTLRASLAASGNVSGASTLIVMQNGKEVARATAPSIATGGGTPVDVSVTANAPAQGGLVRYDVAFENRDSIPDDDVRSIYVFVSDKPAGVAIVSFDPDWEPRFLHPVLADALGLPVRTFLRLPNGVYLRGGDGLEAGGRVDESVVRRAVAEADLLVLHGMSVAAPDWAQQAANTSRRLIIFPDDDGIQAPLVTRPGTDADWYVSPDLPPSPIASLLAGIEISGLPPLTSLQPSVPHDLAWAPILGGRTPRGGNTPFILAEQAGNRRFAAALGRGYWRWAFRGGAARDTYARLWGALAGWIVQEQAQVGGAAIRPVERSVARGKALRWVAPGIAADSLVLQMRGPRGAVSRTVMSMQAGDTAVAAAPAAGHYQYDVAAYSAGQEVARAAGPLTVESYSPEFIRRSANIAELENPRTALAATNPQAGRALHTYTWLYLILIALLSAEWVLRRRWGLR